MADLDKWRPVRMPYRTKAQTKRIGDMLSDRLRNPGGLVAEADGAAYLHFGDFILQRL